LCLLTVLCGLGAGGVQAAGPPKQLNPSDEKTAYRLIVQLRDLPSGWRVEENASKSQSCAKLPSSYVVTGNAASYFSEGQTNYIASVAGVLRTKVGSKGAYTRLSRTLPTCLVRGAKIVGTHISIGAMSFPRVGEKSSAWEVQALVSGDHVSTAVYLDAVLVRKQRSVGVYLFGGISPANVFQEVALVRRAVART
jgi:hypothetical protein